MMGTATDWIFDGFLHPLSKQAFNRGSGLRERRQFNIVSTFNVIFMTHNFISTQVLASPSPPSMTSTVVSYSSRLSGDKSTATSNSKRVPDVSAAHYQTKQRNMKHVNVGHVMQRLRNRHRTVHEQ